MCRVAEMHGAISGPSGFAVSPSASMRLTLRARCARGRRVEVMRRRRKPDLAGEQLVPQCFPMSRFYSLFWAEPENSVLPLVTPRGSFCQDRIFGIGPELRVFQDIC